MVRTMRFAFLSFIVVLLFIVGLDLYLPNIVRNELVYVAASIDKENMLNSLAEKKIVLVGGSNLAFGIDSRQLSMKCKMPVVNMGLHGALGLPFMLNEAEASITSGDVVLLCPEYFLNQGDPRLQAQLVDINQKAYHYMDFSIFDYIRFRVQNIQRCLYALYQIVVNRPLVIPGFNRLSFNTEGDFVDHFGKSSKEKLGDLVKTKDFDVTVNIERLNHFILEAKKKRVQVFIAHPSYCESGYKLNESIINRIDSQYRANLICPVLGDSKTFVFPDSMFFDTVYHLKINGRAYRTRILGSLLAPSIHRRISH